MNSWIGWPRTPPVAALISSAAMMTALRLFGPKGWSRPVMDATTPTLRVFSSGGPRRPPNTAAKRMTITITTTIRPIHIPFPVEGAGVGGASGALCCSSIMRTLARESGEAYNNLSGRLVESSNGAARDFLLESFINTHPGAHTEGVLDALLFVLREHGRGDRGVLSVVRGPRAEDGGAAAISGPLRRATDGAPGGLPALSRVRPDARGEVPDPRGAPLHHHGPRTAVQR